MVLLLEQETLVYASKGKQTHPRCQAVANTQWWEMDQGLPRTGERIVIGVQTVVSEKLL